MSVSSAMVHRLERLGDRFNPIVVKEVRQALKSRQFVATFLLLLLAAWAGSIFGVSVLGESIDYGSSAVAFYAGFLIVLCTATLVIVPFSTFRTKGSWHSRCSSFSASRSTRTEMADPSARPSEARGA